MGSTPQEAMDRIHKRFGAHDGHRALHAKGVHCVGTFTPTLEAARLTRAGHMSGPPVSAKVRFSNGGGDPTVPDYAPDVRGLSVSFQLADGTSTDILAQTLPHFPFRDQEGFLEALAVSKPSAGALLKLPLFLARHPKVLMARGATNRELARRASFAARRYFAFHAFKWIDPEGGERYVRYIWHPTVEESDFTKEEAKGRGRDYLFDELRERLTREPVRMRLGVQVAGEGDDPDDPSTEWPEDRERVTVGTLEVTVIDDEADDQIVFDPMRLVDGIEPSEDPALRFRPAVYTLSHARRTGS
ncbi:MAG: catalase family peroxidase [Actinomycetota bacterium]|nr:catalase family peroxidase [Actinomycetota bacterium]